MSNNSTVVKILIDENASVGVTNRVGKTPCVIAQEQRNKYILDILTREEDRKSPKSFFNYLLRDRVSFSNWDQCSVFIHSPLPSPPLP